MEAEELKRLYEQAGSCSELARWLGLPLTTMRSRLVAAGVTMNKGYKSPKRVRRYAKEHHNWKGGISARKDGYVMEYAPKHPYASGKGYVMQHRLVMERTLGRYLAPTEQVHHINGNRADNRVENLELTTNSAHQKHHKATAPRDAKNGRFI